MLIRIRTNRFKSGDRAGSGSVPEPSAPREALLDPRRRVEEHETPVPRLLVAIYGPLSADDSDLSGIEEE